MRVLMLAGGHLEPDSNNSQAIGGAGRQCLKLSKALLQQNVDVKIVTKRLSWRDPVHRIVNDVPVVYLNTGHPWVDRKGFKRLGVYIYILSAMIYLFHHRNEYDIIHAHSARETGFISALAGNWFKKKSIIKVMNSGFRNDAFQLRQNRSVLGARLMADYLLHCDCAITLNKLAHQELLNLGFRSDQLALIPNGVEVDAIETKPVYNNGQILRMIFVGRLAASKNVGTILKAFKILRDNMGVSSCQLTILGKGELEQQLRFLAETLEIVNQVNFVGEVADVFGYLSSSDIFVLPSHGEGVSNALLEAMASGLACISTDTPGNNTLIQHEYNGLLIGVDNSEVELANAIFRLASDSKLREQFGRTARYTVERQFSIATVADQYISLYKRLLTCSNSNLEN